MLLATMNYNMLIERDPPPPPTPVFQYQLKGSLKRSCIFKELLTAIVQ